MGVARTDLVRILGLPRVGFDLLRDNRAGSSLRGSTLWTGIGRGTEGGNTAVVGDAGADEAENEKVVERDEDESSPGDGMTQTGAGARVALTAPHESSDSR